MSERADAGLRLIIAAHCRHCGGRFERLLNPGAPKYAPPIYCTHRCSFLSMWARRRAIGHAPADGAGEGAPGD